MTVKDYPGKTPPRNRPDSPKLMEPAVGGLRGREFLVGGKPTTMYAIGQVAKILGRRPVTIRSWETKGWMPSPTYRTPKPATLGGGPKVGRRLYTAQQVKLLCEAVERFDVDTSTRPDWKGFRSFLNASWKTLQ